MHLGGIHGDILRENRTRQAALPVLARATGSSSDGAVRGADSILGLHNAASASVLLVVLNH